MDSSSPRPSTTAVETPLTRRSLLTKAGAAAGALAISPALAACGGGGAKRKNSIVIGSFEDPMMDLLRAFLPRFEQETGIRAELLTSDYSTWFEKSVSDAQQGGGAYDVLVLDDPWIPQFGLEDLLADAGELGFRPDTDILDATMDLGYWPPRSGPTPPDAEGQEKRVVAVPIIGDCQSLAYRTDLFRAAPKTYDDVYALAEQRADRDARRYGWACAGGTGVYATSGFSTMFYAFGARYFDDAWQPTLNDERGVRALTFQLDLLRYMPPGTAEFADEQVGRTVARGETFAANLWGGWQRVVFDPKQSKVSDKLQASAPPAGTEPAALIGLYMAGVSRAAANPTGAGKFIKWFTSKEVQRDFARAGGPPVRRSAYQDPQAVEKLPLLSAIGDSLEIGVPRPRTPEWAQVEEAVSLQLNKAYVDGDPSKAKAYLDAAADQAHQILDRAGYYR